MPTTRSSQRSPDGRRLSEFNRRAGGIVDVVRLVERCGGAMLYRTMLVAAVAQAVTFVRRSTDQNRLHTIAPPAAAAAAATVVLPATLTTPRRMPTASAARARSIRFGFS